MPISAGYVARETATNLWRNRLMAIAAILTVAVSLSLVGTSLLMRQAVNNELVQLNQNVDLQVFVKPSASGAEVAALRSTISQTPQIRKIVYLDHEQSYKLACRISGQTVCSVLNPTTTPPVFQCTLTNPGGGGRCREPPATRSGRLPDHLPLPGGPHLDRREQRPADGSPRDRPRLADLGVGADLERHPDGDLLP